MKKVLLTLGLAACSTTAVASGMFQSPSGNILCDGDDAGVQCYIVNKTNKTTYPKPKDCELDWGRTFGVTKTGKAYLVCHGDAFDAFDMPKLAYGKSIKGNGWTCTSQRTGMTCKNTQGHGFKLSRAKQTVF